LTSLSPDLLVALDPEAKASLGSQLRHQLLEAIRSGALRKGVRLPSTRALARQLGVSRPIVLDVYGQLAAEGYLLVRQGARPVVEAGRAERLFVAPEPSAPDETFRFDLRPAMPDVTMFPRRAWLRATRAVLNRLPASDLGYGDLRGSLNLRRVIADYLGRVRGVIADPGQIYITSGFAEGRALTSIAFSAAGVRRLAVENPSYSDWIAVDKAGLERVPIPVDGEGMDIERLAAAAAEAVFVTPAHQFPIGGILSAGRRQRLVQWLQERDRFALEDDYDAEFRYDHAPVGALQGLAPDHVVYAGTVSKTLAPAMRLGWLVVPPRLIDRINGELRRWSEGPPRIEQEALAELIETGAYDRHLQRMRRLYRQRRDLLVECLGRDLPNLKIEGAAAGLHLTLCLPACVDEKQLLGELRNRGVATEGLAHYAQTPLSPSRLFLGYGRASESALRAAVHALAEVMGISTRSN
jgi:GntR family transcriptional regulator/MocR family aminotransferase